MPSVIPPQALVLDLLIKYCISSIAVHETPPLAVLAILKTRRMSDCSISTSPPWLGILADILKSYKKLVAVTENEICILPLPYTTW
jgi:hypothetical protein